MNATEKRRQAEGVAKAEKAIRVLLADAVKANPPVLCNQPDYAHAFGIAAGLASVGVWEEPGRSTSEFQALVDEVVGRPAAV